MSTLRRSTRLNAKETFEESILTLLNNTAITSDNSSQIQVNLFDNNASEVVPRQNLAQEYTPDTPIPSIEHDGYDQDFPLPQGLEDHHQQSFLDNVSTPGHHHSRSTPPSADGTTLTEYPGPRSAHEPSKSPDVTISNAQKDPSTRLDISQRKAAQAGHPERKITRLYAKQTGQPLYCPYPTTRQISSEEDSPPHNTRRTFGGLRLPKRKYSPPREYEHSETPEIPDSPAMLPSAMETSQHAANDEATRSPSPAYARTVTDGEIFSTEHSPMETPSSEIANQTGDPLAHLVSPTPMSSPENDTPVNQFKTSPQILLSPTPDQDVPLSGTHQLL